MIRATPCVPAEVEKGRSVGPPNRLPSRYACSSVLVLMGMLKGASKDQSAHRSNPWRWPSVPTARQQQLRSQSRIRVRSRQIFRGWIALGFLHNCVFKLQGPALCPGRCWLGCRRAGGSVPRALVCSGHRRANPASKPPCWDKPSCPKLQRPGNPRHRTHTGSARSGDLSPKPSTCFPGF